MNWDPPECRLQGELRTVISSFMKLYSVYFLSLYRVLVVLQGIRYTDVDHESSIIVVNKGLYLRVIVATDGVILRRNKLPDTIVTPLNRTSSKFITRICIDIFVFAIWCEEDIIPLYSNTFCFTLLYTDAWHCILWP